MDALASVPASGDGVPDPKILVFNYSFIAAAEAAFHAEALEAQLERLHGECGCHDDVCCYPWWTCRDLFTVDPDADDERYSDAVLVHCRIVRQMPLGRAAGRDCARVRGDSRIDGKLEWFERTEGTAGYARLLTSIR